MAKAAAAAARRISISISASWHGEANSQHRMLARKALRVSLCGGVSVGGEKWRRNAAHALQQQTYRAWRNIGEAAAAASKRLGGGIKGNGAALSRIMHSRIMFAPQRISRRHIARRRYRSKAGGIEVCNGGNNRAWRRAEISKAPLRAYNNASNVAPQRDGIIRRKKKAWHISVMKAAK